MNVRSPRQHARSRTTNPEGRGRAGTISSGRRPAQQGKETTPWLTSQSFRAVPPASAGPSPSGWRTPALTSCCSTLTRRHWPRWPSEIAARGRRALAFAADVTDPARLEAVREQAVAQLGAPTVVVNCAGWSVIVPFVKTDEAFWQKAIADQPDRHDRADTHLPRRHDRRRARPRHQHRQRRRTRRQHRGGRLCRGQGRRDRVHEVARPRNGALRHHRQLRLPRPDGDADAAGAGPQADRRADPRHSAAPPGRTRPTSPAPSRSSPDRSRATSRDRCSVSAAA